MISSLQPILEGKTGLVLGVANKRSIAWSCAQSLSAAGMRVALTYQGDRLEKGVRELAAELPGSIALPCDVTQDESLDGLFAALEKELGGLDALVHAIAFAKREELTGDFFNTSREGWAIAQEVSAFSLLALTRRAFPLMEGRAGSIVTLSYIGGERVVPNYNFIGLAKAALQALRPYGAYDLDPHVSSVNSVIAR